MNKAPASLREKLKTLCVAELAALTEANDLPRREVLADEFAAKFLTWLRAGGGDQGRLFRALDQPRTEAMTKRLRIVLHGFPPTNEKLRMLYLALIGEASDAPEPS